MDDDIYYAFQVKCKDEYWSIGPVLNNRTEAGIALSGILMDAMEHDYPKGAVLQCYSAPKSTEWPQSIWARIPLDAGKK